MKSFKKIITTLLCLGAITIGVGACNKSNKKHDPYPGDENWVDFVHDGSVKLNLDYKDKDFYKDGVGQFTLKTAIDGDTAHFTPLVDSLHMGTMKARFFGIDTPESTGKVQEYGKPASNFTKEQLKIANEKGTIVVSSAQNDYGEPNPDSTGSRYVSLVWVNLEKKNAPLNELYLLNLWIVQEGLSWVKNVASMPQYENTFIKAESQAKEYKLNLHSGVPDPTFNYGDYEDASLLEIADEVAASLNDPDHVNAFDNKKIRIQGTVAGYSNHILYLEDKVYLDKDNPELGFKYCGINIFVGMTPIPTKYTKLNTFIQVCGLAQYTENYGFQVTDTQGRYKAGSPTNESDAKIIYTPEENETTDHNLFQFEYTAEELSNIAKAKDPYDLSCLNCFVGVSDELVVKTAYISDSAAEEITLNFTNADFSVYVPFNYYGDPDAPSDRWKTKEKFEGHRFTIQGVYVFHKTQAGKITFQVVPSKNADLVFVA